jgi:hypothetical protein
MRRSGIGQARPSRSAAQHARVSHVRRVVYEETNPSEYSRRRDMRRRDRLWLAILTASFVFGLAASWERWANPVIDAGREMNQPLRIASGEVLYSEVGHIYGPLSPWIHAALYRAFGPSLTTLYADGIVCAIAILAMVYWLARRIMTPAAAGTATLTVMWICTFKPAGNYIVPYAYSALHGTLLGLATLALLAAAVNRPTAMRFVAAGLVAGFTLLAKTEMGLSAVCAGVAAALLAARGDARRTFVYGAAFVAPAAALAGVVYVSIAARLGWSTLVVDNWLLFYNLPAPLAYFNAGLSGFDHPTRSLARMLVATVKLGIIAAVVGATSYLVAGPRGTARRAWLVLVLAVAVGAVLSVTTGLDWDRGPFLAMPIVLVAVLVMLVRGSSSDRTRLVTLYAVFALAQLARMLLHVRSGGAYGSFLLPVSVIVFTYLWVGPFAEALPDPAPRRVAYALALSLLIVSAAGTSVVLAYRYRRSNTAVISTERGTMIAPPDVARAWNQALAYIAAHTAPGDTVAVLPEGTSLDYLSARRNPLREEIVTPGFLDDAGETRAIASLETARTPLVLIVNRPTREFGAEAFGRDYCRRLMAWLDTHYTPCATFGAQDPRLRVGDTPFFIRAHCLNP